MTFSRFGKMGGGSLLRSNVPYDYRVEYIQRDFSVPWTDMEGNIVKGGFDLTQYLPADAPMNTYNYVMEGKFSGTPAKTMINVCVLHYKFKFMGYIVNSGNIGAGLYTIDSGSQYCFRTGGSYAETTDVISSITTPFTFKIVTKDSQFDYYIGNTLFHSETYAYSYSYAGINLLEIGSVGNYPNEVGMGRLYSFKLNNLIDVIPVVKGNKCGFYNRVDGNLFLTDQYCVSPGPKVSSN